MNVITNRPVYSEPTSNCCGMSNADGDLKNMAKDYLSAQKTSRKSSRTDTVKNILNDRTTANQTRRDNRATKRTDRQVNRSSRKEARFTRRQDRKAKRNSKKLALIKVQGKEKYFFPLSRVRLGKKTYKDGTTAEVKTADQITITTPTGEVATFDKNEIAKAMGISANAVTQESLRLFLYPIPKQVTDEQGINKELGGDTKEQVYSVPPPEDKIETANDGELYLSQDVQDTSETEKDVKDEEKGLTKTQKIVLWSAVGVATLLIGYVIYKSVTKSQSSAV
jgi:hypothetical protein